MRIQPVPRRRYPHAPITEALIAIGYELPSETRLEDILRVREALKSDYPGCDEQFTVQIKLDVAERTGRTTPSEPVGYRLLSADGRRVVRVTLTDFAFSQLAPYDRWDVLHGEARRTWDVVDRILQPRQINRIGVRFINRIDIPATNNLGIDLDVYFHVAPRVPPELPQVMSTYFVRLAVPFESPGGVLILTLTAIPPPATGLVSALLDIDAVVQDIQMDALTAWRTVNDLRDVKNAAFEASITDAARELFR